MNAKDKIIQLLKGTGIEINGSNLWDIKVNNSKVFARILAQGSLGFGNAYMDGWWDCDRIDIMMEKIILANLHKKLKTWSTLGAIIKAKLINHQSTNRAKQVGEKHYDLGNELYGVMLDDLLNYSCGYWKKTDRLEEAQIAKLELICQKLQLRPGMKVLDIGCGWGGFAKYATGNYGVEVVGITISKEQCALAKEICKDLPIEIKLQDYRTLTDKFDAIVSIGMFEHVGYKNYKTFMKVVHRLLKDNGLFLLHTIGGNTSVHNGDPWIDKHIFCNGMLPSPKQVTTAIEGLFTLEDWHNFGADYDKTLMAWHQNFTNNWEKIKHLYDDRFYRMWNFYLLTCAGSFRARKNQLWQIVLTKQGQVGGYQSIR
ncbi:MAG: cyclopropane fatty acyl phospholipid synthase [Patescibacteria group bacterium]